MISYVYHILLLYVYHLYIIMYHIYVYGISWLPGYVSLFSGPMCDRSAPRSTEKPRKHRPVAPRTGGWRCQFRDSKPWTDWRYWGWEVPLYTTVYIYIYIVIYIIYIYMYILYIYVYIIYISYHTKCIYNIFVIYIYIHRVYTYICVIIYLYIKNNVPVGWGCLFTMSSGFVIGMELFEM